MTVKLAIIGSGAIAGFHMDNVAKMDGAAKAVAACDIDADRVKEFAESRDIPRYYTDYTKLLENETPDAVLVATPNYAHMEPTVAALEAGISVYCEKPMAMNVGEAERMVAAAKASKGVLTIGHHMRFQSDSAYVHQAVESGELGDVYFARTVMHRRGGVPWWGAFHIKDKSGGGALIDIGVHVIDLVMWLMGSPTPVQVTGQTYDKLAKRTDGERPNQDPEKAGEFDVDDFATAYVKMSNGASLAIECSWASNIAEGHQSNVELYGDEGGATLHPLGIYTQRHGQFVNLAPHSLPKAQAHAEAMGHFLRVVKGEAENAVKPEETLNVQRILDGIYESSKTGKTVEC
jgi:predicted dehydrogenase